MNRKLVSGWCLAWVLITAACGSDSTTATPTTAEPTTAPTTQQPAAQKVRKSQDPVEPVDVTSLWVRRDGDRVWTETRPPQEPLRTTGIPALEGMLPWPVASLRDGTIAIAGGYDGATVFPLSRVVASTDGGDSWTTYDVPEVEGERRSTTGHVLLSDRRLLVLVSNWSDDRVGQPSDRHHGFFVSDADDLGKLRPFHPRFSPPLTPTIDPWPAWVSLDASAAPDPVLWTATWDHRLYYSIDDGRRFTELTLP